MGEGIRAVDVQPGKLTFYDLTMIVGETRGHIETNHIVLPLSEEQKQQFSVRIFKFLRLDKCEKILKKCKYR